MAASLAFSPWWASHEPKWFIISGIAAFGLFHVKQFSRADIAGLVFIGYSALSLLWAPDLKEGLMSLRYIVCFFGVFLLIEHTKLTLGVPALLAVIGTYGLVAFFPMVIGGFGSENWITEFLLVATVLVFGLGRWIGLLAGLAFALYAAFWNTSLVELAAGISAFGIYAIYRKRWVYALPLLIPIVLIWLPVVPHDNAISSFETRAEIWTNSILLWLDSPLGGTGLGGFNFEYPKYQEAHLAYLPDLYLDQATWYVGQAHNEILQVLAELGIVGLLLAGLFLALVFKAPWAEDKKAPFLGLLAIGATALIAFPLQNPGTAFVSAACLGQMARGSASSRVVLPLRGALFSQALGLLAIIYPLYAAQSHFERAVQHLSVGNNVAALQENAAAVNLFDYPARFRRQLGLTLHALVQREDRTLRLDDAAADRINDIAMSAGPMPATLLVRLDYLLQSQRNPVEAARLMNTLLGRHPNLQEVKVMKESL